jgi:hypothetical protein
VEYAGSDVTLDIPTRSGHFPYMVPSSQGRHS